MKLVAFEAGDASLMGVVSAHGAVSPLTEVDAFYGDLDRWTEAARSASSEPLRSADLKLVPAIPRTARILCVGLNYRAHAAEGGFQPPPHPTLFGRWHGSLSVDGAPVPAIEPALDWEGELAMVIGREAFRVAEADALAHVFAYAAFNDISARTYQRHTTQWTLGKNADGSGPMGALVTADEVGDPADGLQLTTRVNGEVVQSATTADMIYSLPRIIAYVSEILTLHPGDMIVTGTPEGVGYARTPPWFLVPGDVVEVEIERVGSVRNPIVSVADYAATLPTTHIERGRRAL